MNSFYVFAACLAATLPTVATQLALDVAHETKACSSHLADEDFCAHTSLLQTSLTLEKPGKATDPLAIISKPDTHSTHHFPILPTPRSAVPSSSARAASGPAKKAVLLASHLKEKTKEREKLTVDSASLYWARCHAGLRRMAGQAGSGNATILIVAMLLVCMLVCLFEFFMPTFVNPMPEHDDHLPAHKLLDKPKNRGPVASAQDSRLPQAAVAIPDTSPIPDVKEQANDSWVPGVLSQMQGGSWGGLTGDSWLSPRSEAVSKVPHGQFLVPELVVQEAQGMQFFMDGTLQKGEQNGYVDISRVDADRSQTQVLQLLFCEGSTGPQGHQNGVSVRIPWLSRSPLVFINTQFALPGIPRTGAHKHACSPNRHCTLFDVLDTLDFTHPFCTAELEPRGVTLRRVSGEVIMVVSSGGYNTDFGNITDGSGRLLATMSNRGHSMLGVGMITGQWKENRRVIQISQGNDAALIIAAIVCAVKLQ